MREVIFKAKRLDDGAWIEGYLFMSWESAFILWGTTNGVPDMVEVDPSTVCQYVGILGKEGKRIYEGDLVEAWSEGSHQTLEVRWRQEAHPCYILYPAYRDGQWWKLHGTKQKDGTYTDDVKIVGNIHDR